MINLRQLQCARALSSHRHFGRAADAIGITQSGFTQNIQRLEEHYGVQLFTRERNDVAPTVFGEVLLEGAVAVLDRLADVEREISLLNGLERGQLVIGADPMLANSLLAPALTTLLAQHPQLRFTVTAGGVDDLMVPLRNREIDLFIGFPSATTAPGIAALHMDLPSPTVVCRSSHPVLGTRKITLADLLDYPLIQGPIAQWYIDWASKELNTDALNASELLQPYFLRASETALLINLAQDSDALFAAMRTDVEQALERGDLAEVVPPRWPKRVPAVVMWQESRARAPAADRLIDAVLDACVRLGGRVS